MLMPIALLGFVPFLVQDPHELPAPASLSHALLNQRLQALAGEHPEIVSILPIGRSREDREILAVKLAAGSAPGQPAILVVANIDGPRVFSSTVALWEAQELARRWAENDEAARALLESTTLYFLPRANPDAAEARFGAPLLEREAGGRGVDNDRDRREGEDDAGDVDGDRLVCEMRYEDPEGEWIEDPTDPRALIRAEAAKGQRGRFKRVVEGRDSDGDEEVAEDPAHDTWLNRNFPHDWEEHGEHAGLFPLDEPEARALADFMLQHEDIGLVLTYGALDNLVEKPKSVKAGAPPQKRIPQPGVIEPDAEILAEIGKRYVATTGNKTKGRAEPAGSFQAWVYQHRGLLSLEVCLWDMPLEAKKEEPKDEDASEDTGGDAGEQAEQAPEPSEDEAEAKLAAKAAAKDEQDEIKPSDEAKRLQWIDSVSEGSRFKPWSAFDHPELGPVEIGGWVPYSRIEPPTAEAPGLAEKQLEFLISLGRLLPRVRIAECTARALGGGLFEIEAALENDALLPLQTASGRRARTIRPARVRLVIPDGSELLAGSAQELVRSLDGSGGRSEFRWMVRAREGSQFGVEVDTDHAGSQNRRAEVK
jgi:hypothetical protein